MASGYNGYAHFRDGCTAATNPGTRFGAVPDHCRCTITAKSTGERCRCKAAKGQKRCRNHGAKGMKPTRAKMLRIAARLRGERPENYHRD